MNLLWIWLIVFVLYIRTIHYHYVIDDIVPRDGYLINVPLQGPPDEFFKKRPSPWYRLFMIGMHCVNVSVVYLLWGWCPALLFAVHPLSVWGTAWVTGNYYATATYFTLIAYYILHTFPNIWGALAAMPIYAAALNSTVCPMMFPFLFFFIGEPWGLTMFFPLVMFLRGRRFRTGIKTRLELNNNKVVREKSVKVNYFRRLALMTKVVARYIFPCLCPNKLGFFDNYGRNLKHKPEVWNQFHSFDLMFWVCFSLCLSVFLGGLMINPFGIFWFFTFIMLHSQWNLTGQFHAQRYLYLALIGMCIVVGTMIQNYPFVVTAVTTFLIVRTHLFIPAWRNQESVWNNDIEMYPHVASTWNNASQYYLNNAGNMAWELNRMGYYLFRAEYLEPDAWEVQMNLACFFTRMGNLELSLERTNKAIELLKPLGGITKPIDLLTDQKARIEEFIKNQKENNESKTVQPIEEAVPV